MYIFNSKVWKELEYFVENHNFSKIIIIDDINTHKYCLPILKDKFSFEFKTITIQDGDENKNIQTLEFIWNKLIDFDVDRKSLILNLGGGVVTDIGGFAASTFKRGIRYIHIPTSLLAMVDASIGGKNGINYRNAKNQIGNIINPEKVLIDKIFLKTLNTREILSGYAEMLKHGLIADKNYWYKLIENIQNIDVSDSNFYDLIIKSVFIKNNIVKNDPKEKSIRKTLNFGHTLGHAIESYSHKNQNPITHGHAVALGMIVAAHISYQKKLIRFTNVNNISESLLKAYQIPDFLHKDQEGIMEYLKYDKKNVNGKYQFVLLKEIGKPVIDIPIKLNEIKNAFEYILQLKK